MTNTNEN